MNRETDRWQKLAFSEKVGFSNLINDLGMRYITIRLPKTEATVTTKIH